MNGQGRFFGVAGAVCALLAVALGAFGAHALQGSMTADLMAVYQTGNSYHFYHSFALLAVGLAARHVPGRLLAAGGWCFLAGTLLFSGSLYALAITGLRALGAITPIGGILFIVGWALFAAAILSAKDSLGNR